MADEILTWQCPECSRVFKSLYPNQLEQWKKTHLKTHEKK